MLPGVGRLPSPGSGNHRPLRLPRGAEIERISRYPTRFGRYGARIPSVSPPVEPMLLDAEPRAVAPTPRPITAPISPAREYPSMTPPRPRPTTSPVLTRLENRLRPLPPSAAPR